MSTMQQGIRLHELTLFGPRPRVSPPVATRWKQLRQLRCLVVLGFAVTADAQTMSGPALVKSLQAGGHVIVMRHASSPGQIPDKPNADNVPPERQLDDKGRSTATAIGEALRRLKIPVGEVLTSPTYRA